MTKRVDVIRYDWTAAETRRIISFVRRGKYGGEGVEFVVRELDKIVAVTDAHVVVIQGVEALWTAKLSRILRTTLRELEVAVTVPAKKTQFSILRAFGGGGSDRVKTVTMFSKDSAGRVSAAILAAVEAAQAAQAIQF